jgi:hypothetical protein
LVARPSTTRPGISPVAGGAGPRDGWQARPIAHPRSGRSSRTDRSGRWRVSDARQATRKRALVRLRPDRCELCRHHGPPAQPGSGPRAGGGDLGAGDRGQGAGRRRPRSAPQPTGASASVAYRRHRQLDREDWRPGWKWRAGVAGAAAVTADLLISPSMGVWLGWRVALLVALLAGWRLRFRPSRTARVWPAAGVRGGSAVSYVGSTGKRRRLPTPWPAPPRCRFVPCCACTGGRGRQPAGRSKRSRWLP